MKLRGRRSTTEHVNAVIEGVKKLMEASAITEVLYPSWLSNTVVVKKKTDKWRVCRFHKSQSSLSEGLLSFAKN